MAKNKDTDNASGILIFIILAIAVIGYFLIKWAVIVLIILISAIIVWIVNLCRKNSSKKSIKNIEENIFKNSNIKPVSKITKKELKEKLGLFDIDIYNEAKGENNIPIILKEITDYSNKLSKMINEEIEYINKNQKNMKLNSNAISIFDNNIVNLKNKLEKVEKNIDKYKSNENILLDTLINLIESSYSFNRKLEALIINAGKVDNPVSIEKVYNANKKEDKIRLRDVAAGYVIADEVSKKMNEKEKNVNKKLEKEMDNNCLEDWQKDLVRKRRI